MQAFFSLLLSCFISQTSFPAGRQAHETTKGNIKNLDQLSSELNGHIARFLDIKDQEKLAQTSTQLRKNFEDVFKKKSTHLEEHTWAERLERYVLAAEISQHPDVFKFLPVQYYTDPMETTSATNYYESAFLSPDEKFIASILNSGKVKIFSTTTGELIHSLDTSAKKVFFHPTQKELVVESNQEVQIWNLDSGELVRTINLGTDLFHALSPDGEEFLTLSVEDHLKIWTLRTEEPVQTINGLNRICTAYFHPKRTEEIIVVTHLGFIKIWNKNTSQWITDVETNFPFFFFKDRLSFSPDGEQIAYLTDNPEEQKFIIWNLRTGQKVQTIRLDGYVRSTSFSPDGEQIITTRKEGQKKTIEIFKIETGKRVQEFDNNSLDNSILGPLTGGFHYQTASFFPQDSTKIITTSRHEITVWSSLTKKLDRNNFSKIKKFGLLTGALIGLFRRLNSESREDAIKAALVGPKLLKSFGLISSSIAVCVVALIHCRRDGLEHLRRELTIQTSLQFFCFINAASATLFSEGCIGLGATESILGKPLLEGSLSLRNYQFFCSIAIASQVKKLLQLSKEQASYVKLGFIFPSSLILFGEELKTAALSSLLLSAIHVHTIAPFSKETKRLLSKGKAPSTDGPKTGIAIGEAYLANFVADLLICCCLPENNSSAKAQTAFSTDELTALFTIAGLTFILYNIKNSPINSAFSRVLEERENY